MKSLRKFSVNLYRRTPLKVSFRVRYGAPQVRTLAKIRAKLYGRTPHYPAAKVVGYGCKASAITACLYFTAVAMDSVADTGVCA